MSSGTPLDSYECSACGAWMHMPGIPYDEQGPDYCAYCGQNTLQYRMHNHWKLVEVDPPKEIEWLEVAPDETPT